MVDLTHHWGCHNPTHKLLTSPMTPWRPHPYLIIRERCGTKHLQSLRRSEDPTVQRQKYITFYQAMPLQVICGFFPFNMHIVYKHRFIFSRSNTNNSSYACGTGIAWRPAMFRKQKTNCCPENEMNFSWLPKTRFDRIGDQFTMFFAWRQPPTEERTIEQKAVMVQVVGILWLYDTGTRSSTKDILNTSRVVSW